MKVKNELSMEQMLHLKDLGFNIDDASMAWTRMVTDMGGNHIDRPWRLLRNEPIAISNMEDYESIPTFTLADILNVLPKEIHESFHDAKLCVYDGVIFYRYADDDHSETIAASKIEDGCLIDAAYRILCDLIENGYIETRI